MSVIESDALGRAQEFQHGGKGPVTASRHRRNAVIYALLCVAALTPAQLRALDVGSVWLVRLTPTQISWLTAAQIKTLRLP